MFRPDSRLALVVDNVRDGIHADIGADHGLLIKHLLSIGRIAYGIAVENKSGPAENARRNLAGLAAEVRFGDGLTPLRSGEVNSLSICGMGAKSIIRILRQHPERVPQVVIIQPNTQFELVRQWGFESGFHLTDERIARGQRMEHVMVYQRGDGRSDPAYQGLDLASALCFGPWQIRRRCPRLLDSLRAEQRRLESLPCLETQSRKRLVAIHQVLSLLGTPKPSVDACNSGRSRS